MVLNPKWTKGHLLLARVSFKLFQRSKNNSFKGAIRLSKLAIEKLVGSTDSALLVEAMYLFCDKQYLEVVQKLIPVVNENCGLGGVEKALAYELIGGSYLIIGSNIEAKSFFEKIEENQRTNEVREMLKYLNSINS